MSGFSIFVYMGSSHRRKSAACPKFDMVLAISLAYPSGEEGVNFLVQMISTCLRNNQRGGGSAPCAIAEGGRCNSSRLAYVHMYGDIWFNFLLLALQSPCPPTSPSIPPPSIPPSLHPSILHPFFLLSAFSPLHPFLNHFPFFFSSAVPLFPHFF
jgi:hypothetical protein